MKLPRWRQLACLVLCLTTLPLCAQELAIGATASVPSRVVSGRVSLIVKLSDAPLAVVAGTKRALTMTPTQQKAYLAMLKSKQDGIMQNIAGLGGHELGRVSIANNAIAVDIDASQIDRLANIAGVTEIRPLVDFQTTTIAYPTSPNENVPYIKAAQADTNGLTGNGIRVLVMDSGIDYTHADFGGPGTTAAYLAAKGADGTVVNPSYFPTAKVIGGYDFIGDTWPTTSALVPDPNPIDIQSHGTHVADIIAGKNGVAPGAKLYIAKVCSSVSTSCSGLGMMEAVDFAFDPEMVGYINNPVDTVNVSIGASYGQREQSLSEAIVNAVKFGIIFNIAAGNNGNIPYVVSESSTAPDAISVAQTQVASAKGFILRINSPSSLAGDIKNTATVDWAPIVGTVTADVAYVGRGCPAHSVTPDNPADDVYGPDTDVSGKIALIDRGACSVSLKVDRAAAAGALAVVIVNNAAGDPPSFSFGGGTNLVPTLILSQSDGTSLENARNASITVNATLSDSVFVNLAGSMASTSARGPSTSYNAIKPDIGAPGASVSAQVGTGTGETAFGGTSGATPMITGATALMLEKRPTLTPQEVKALLMNNADTNILHNPITSSTLLAPITRIGGGEARVAPAIASQTAMWDASDPAAVSLSFGFYRLIGKRNLAKKVTVRNYSNAARTYTISKSFRYADDAASGAVTLTTPGSINVPANGANSFVIMMTIDPAKLPNWTLNNGSNGGNGALLNTPEYDGYVTIADATDTVHLPWHVLPHKVANVRPNTTSLTLSGGSGTLTLSNLNSPSASGVEFFALTGTSSKLPAAVLPNPGDNYAVIDLKSFGVRAAGSTATQFAINTWGQRGQANYPAEFDIYVDTNNDLVPDYVVYNAENSGFGATGQNVTCVVNLGTNASNCDFYTTADFDSSNVIMTVLNSRLGISSATKLNVVVFAFDNYFSGFLTDNIGDVNGSNHMVSPMTVTTGNLRYPLTGTLSSLASGGTVSLGVSHATAGDTASPSQSGLLLMYFGQTATGQSGVSLGQTDLEADAIAVQ